MLLVSTREVGKIDVCIDLPFLAHEDIGIDLCLETVARSVLQYALVTGITEGDVVLGNGIATLDTEQVIVGHRIAVDGILPIGIKLIEVGIVGSGTRHETEVGEESSHIVVVVIHRDVAHVALVLRSVH